MYKDAVCFAEKEVEDGKVVLQIVRDDVADSPREWSNLGTMVCWHRSYELGDKHNFEDSYEMQSRLLEEIGIDDIDGESLWECSINALNEVFKEYFVALPLYLLDHSGISMSCSDFHDQWDSGQVGWIYVSLDKCREEMIVSEGEDIRQRAKECLQGEVEVYDMYLRGEVYGYFLTKETICSCCGQTEKEDIDSCWGFYGSDFSSNGLKENLPSEYQELVDQLEYC